jgi:glycosyltransferase involved in cell wall biosynthesis
VKLSIVVPAYNESKRIARMLDAYLAYFLPRYGTEVEIIVVVNGSRDNTAEIARTYSLKYPQVGVIEEKEAIGKGGAIILGFKCATGDLIGFSDADGSTSPAAFDDLAVNIGSAGAIIASRWFAESVVEPKQPLKRRIASRIFNFIVRTTFGMNIHDTQCGAKVLRHETVQKIIPHLGITRWAFDVDLLFQVHRSGYAITEWPTVWKDVEGSQLRIVRASVEMFIAIVRLRLIYSPFRWIVTVYDRTIGRFWQRR